jgi:drug/metabolite transporter (DMT)-like permease
MSAHSTSPHLRAAFLMLASTISFGLMAVCIRLSSTTEPVFEIAFFRNLFGLLALLPVLLWPALRSGRPGAVLRHTLQTTQLPRYFVRCLIGVVSMYFGFWSIANLPLSQAIALAYSSPIFVTIAAVLMLGEKVRLRRWMAVLAGFIGVIVIVRPWSQAFTMGSLVAVSAAVITAVVAIQIKRGHDCVVDVSVLGAAVGVACTVGVASTARHHVVVAGRVGRTRYRWSTAVDARVEARGSLGTNADQLRATGRGDHRRLVVVRRNARPLDRDRRRDHL